MSSIGEKLGLIGTTEAAALLKISVDTLKRLAYRDEVPYVTTPLGRLFVRSEITEYAKTFVPPRRGRPPKRKRRRTRSGVPTGEQSTRTAGASEQSEGGEA
ncbi:helix-turn-helix domain-containing protein [Saccharopolyspora sp. NPDC003752]